MADEPTGKRTENDPPKKDGRFKPGNKGGGRPSSKGIREALKPHAPKLIETLLKLAAGGAKTPKAVQLQAVKLALAYVYGDPEREGSSDTNEVHLVLAAGARAIIESKGDADQHRLESVGP